MTVHGGSRVLGVFGDPVEHSLSPRIHHRFAEATGADTVYVPFHVTPYHLATATAAVRALDLGGVNVTVPHKEAIMAHMDAVTDTARAIGAVNTVLPEGERLVGDNTDSEGFRTDLAAHLGHTGWESGPVVVLGAGGAARAVVHALDWTGVPEIIVANRNPERARALVAELAPETGRAVALPGEELTAALGQAGLLVNTTSVGLKGERFEGVDLKALPAEAGVYDLIYNPARTPLLEEATERGLAVANGLGMLVRQGAISYARWTGTEPPVEPVLAWLASELDN